MFKSAGIAPPTKEHDWELPKEINKMVEEQLHFGKFNGIVRSIVLRGLKGYTPADAGEDFKEHQNCIPNVDGEIQQANNSKKVTNN